jgi:hypothetical protein
MQGSRGAGVRLRSPTSQVCRVRQYEEFLGTVRFPYTDAPLYIKSRGAVRVGEIEYKKTHVGVVDTYMSYKSLYLE